MPDCGCPVVVMLSRMNIHRRRQRGEAREELGITAEFVWPDPIFLTVTQTQGMSAGHTDVSLWYVLYGDRNVKLTCDPGEFHGMAWFAFEGLPRERVEPHLARFVLKLNMRLSRLTHREQIAGEHLCDDR